jgi:hypothetical protein
VGPIRSLHADSASPVYSQARGRAAGITPAEGTSAFSLARLRACALHHSLACSQDTLRAETRRPGPTVTMMSRADLFPEESCACLLLFQRTVMGGVMVMMASTLFNHIEYTVAYTSTSNLSTTFHTAWLLVNYTLQHPLNQSEH